MFCRSAPERVALAALAFLALAPADVHAAVWQAWPWVSVSSGHEDEISFDPTLDRAAVPGGPFLNLTPGVEVERPVGERSGFRFIASGSLDRFFDESRRMVGLAVTSELTLRSPGRLYGRLSLSADGFEDSGMEEAGRRGLAAGATLGLGGRRMGFEAFVGLRGRSYPDLEVLDESGVPAGYSETAGTAGACVYGAAGRRLAFRLDANARSTDANDPLFDSIGWEGVGSIRLRLARRWDMLGSAMLLDRRFDKRPAGEDRDDYLRLGARFQRTLRSGDGVGLSYSHIRYVDPFGLAEDSDRVAAFWVHEFRRGKLPPPPPARPAHEADPRVDGQAVRFRLQVAEASRVAVVGDFNGWDPERTALARSSDEWWEAELSLPVGSFQYAYVVDGRRIVPPNATTSVDDGFGGRNGLFVVVDGNPAVVGTSHPVLAKSSEVEGDGGER